MLPWFRADTEAMYETLLEMRFTPEQPCPRALAVTFYRAIVASDRVAKWSHQRFADATGLTYAQARRVIHSALEPVEKTGKKQVSDRPQAGDAQVSDRAVTGDAQVRSDTGAEIEESKDRPQAGDAQVSDRAVTGDAQVSDPRARKILDLKILEEDLDGDRRKDKKEDPPLRSPHAQSQFSLLPEPTQACLPGFPQRLRTHPESGGYLKLWDTLHPAERDVFSDLAELWDYWREVSNTRARLPTAQVYRDLRKGMLVMGLDGMIETIEGAQIDPWTVQRSKQHESGWVFQQRNLEKFSGSFQRALKEGFTLASQGAKSMRPDFPPNRYRKRVGMPLYLPHETKTDTDAGEGGWE